MADFKYVLFTHLPNTDAAWKTFDEPFNKGGRTRGDALADCLSRTEGLLIVFVDAGWLSLLNTIGLDFDPVRMAKEFNEIEQVEKKVANLCSRYKRLTERLRLVTAKTLYPILNNLRGNKPGLEAARLKSFLVGSDPGVRYDTTKVVEAIIRVRHLGSGIPVLRIDWDALLNDETLSGGHLKNLALTVPAYCNELAQNYQIHSYVVSGSYVQPKADRAKWDINAFNTAFATRMFPALIPTPKVCTKLDETPANDKNGRKIDCGLFPSSKTPIKTASPVLYLDDLAGDGLFDRQAMNAFYNGLPAVGSDPDQAVVSGAGLAISDGAILDLPPFSNFQQNVMWIDDHLKFALHFALGHFAEATTSVSPVAEVPARHPKARVYKDRILAGQGNLRPYTLGSYIPTLFWGILMDAWIRGALRSPRSPFVTALETALKTGRFADSEARNLRQELKSMAIDRSNAVIESWSALTTANGDKSYAALWVGADKAAVEAVMGRVLSPPKEGDNWLGWGLLNDGAASPISDLDQLRAPVRKIVLQLIDDVCTYIEWTLDWPKFVQSVRAVKTGSLALDVSYTPP